MTERIIPQRYQRAYDMAMSGRSRKYGVKSFCLECVGYFRNEVARCSDHNCPLYPYRPYKRVKKDEVAENLQQDAVYKDLVVDRDEKALEQGKATVKFK